MLENIPKRIKVQIKDSNSVNIEMSNILCDLKIYINEANWYNYSCIPTNSNGQIILTKEEIIHNTGLKNVRTELKHENPTSVKFELCIIDNKLLDIMISSLQTYLEKGPKELKRELRMKGLIESRIEVEITKVLRKQNIDRTFYSGLIKNQNANLMYSMNLSKIKGIWHGLSSYEYELLLR